MSPVYWVAFGILLFGFATQFFTPLPLFRLGTPEALIVGIYLETKSVKAMHMILFLLVFAPIWFIATILAIGNTNKKEWFHTPHGLTKHHFSA
jgi:hypothetical protein